MGDADTAELGIAVFHLDDGRDELLGRPFHHQGNEQMDRQDEQIAHDWQIITPANLHKAALGSDSCQSLTNSPPTGSAGFT
jgi:hypothetical protein